MKSLLKICFLLSLCLCGASGIRAQIPYYAPTAGHGNLNGYTSLKFRPGINAQESYTSFQLGIGSLAAAGLDLYTSGSEIYGGLIARAGYMPCRRFGVGVQLAPAFRVDDSMKFSFLSAGLFMNGDISSDGRFFWAANTWYTARRHGKDDAEQYMYLGMNVPLPRGSVLTPMAGTIYSWEFDRDADLALGVYWTVGKFCFYLWGNDLLESRPRMVVGLEFTIDAL